MFDVILGIMTSLGGFVDMGNIVFALAGGARFDYSLLWVLVVATLGIILFAEMAGRIAAVAHKPAFEVLRNRLPPRMALAVLVASNIVNVLTCAAEIGGIAVVLQLLCGADYRMMLLTALALLLAALYFLKFRWLERIFGLLGMALLVYVWAAIELKPDWHGIYQGLLPGLPHQPNANLLTYCYYAVGLFSSVLTPYEIHFYSSGGMEDGWSDKDTASNISNAAVGFTLGGILTMFLVIVGAQVLLPQGIDPKMLSTAVLPVADGLGMKGMFLALLGILFAVGGAAVESALSGAYDTAQFFDLPWGKNRPPKQTAVFTWLWMGTLVLGCAIAMSGVDPTDIVEYSVVFAVVVLPFTYYPILQAAADKKLMGHHANSRFISVLGWAYFVLIVLAGVSAVPLMLLTHMGDA
ncbi:flagellar M-ring protein [Novimethylophilus kurashikiensis]|uniref:Flagellar M-ring protein n=1 Tax=Novimethylophilus kurashikiensis TaxID=1825523 RepID=A0A2R5F700_9PROT|nr:divalent metal cation transporter [Novimethylophilus kurashikiensis]GBG14010.1 flagellar M-ring protein [Novimethylophilus kurashikiensis]